MTDRRRRQVSEPQPTIDPPGEILEDQSFDAIDRLGDELPEGGAPFTVVVSKRSADGRRINRCKRFPLEGFEVDQLPVLFGGGDFKLWILDGAGHKVRNYEVSFDTELYPPVRPLQPGVAPVAVAHAPSSIPADAAILERLQTVERALEQERATHLHFLETIAQGALRQAPAAGAGLQDQLATFKALLDVVRDAGGGKTPAHEIGEAMRMAFDMAREAVSGRAGETAENDGDVWGSIMERFGKPLIDAIVSRTQPGQPRPGFGPSVVPQRPTLAPAPAPTGPRDIFGNPAAPPTPAAGPLPGEWASFEFLRNHTGHLVECARAHTDPETVAAFAYENTPDRFVPALEKFVNLTAQERADLLGKLDPRLAGHLAYLEQVAESIRAEFAAVGEDDADVRPGSA